MRLPSLESLRALRLSGPLQRLVVALLSIAVLIALRSYREWDVVVEEQTNQCAIDPWGEYREYGPWPTMYKYCTNGLGDEERVRALMNAVELGAPEGHDMVTSADFGSNILLAYFPRLKWMALNPRITERSPDLIECRDFFQGVEIVKMRSKWVRVASRPKSLIEETRLVENRAAVCLIQAFLD